MAIYNDINCKTKGAKSIGGGRKFCLGGQSIIIRAQSAREIFGPRPFFKVQRSLVAIEVLLQSPAKKWWDTCAVVDSRGYSRQLLTVIWSMYL